MFEPLVVKSQPVATINASEPQDKTIFELKQKGVDAKGVLTSEGFVLLRGSLLKTTLTASCPKPARQQRERYAAKIDEAGVLQEDLLLKSPNMAAGFVTGASINAQQAWKTAEGVTLKELDAKE